MKEDEKEEHLGREVLLLQEDLIQRRLGMVLGQSMSAAVSELLWATPPPLQRIED